jgi:hypothetical protein
MLALTGSMTPDLAFLSERMTAAVGQQVTLSGRNPSDFRFALPLQSPVMPNQATLSAKLQLDAVLFRGVQLRGVEVPLEVEKGRVELVLEDELYGGRVTLKPQWHLGASVPELRIPGGSKVLKGADVQSPLAAGVLTRLHPLFGSLARAEGSVDLVLERFVWAFPKGRARQPVFSATLTTEEARFQPAEVLASLLALFGLDPAELRFEPGVIRCEARDGRVTSEPVRLRCGEMRMTLQGATGLNGALAYRLRLPITEHLVGKERYARLAGQSVEVPISGTLTAPRVDRDELRRVLEDQLRARAGQKETAPQKQPEDGPEQPAPER